MTTIGLETRPRTAPETSSMGTETRRSRLNLDPLRKAAILVVSLEESLARQILSHLDRADVDAVSLEMARLEAIEAARHRLLDPAAEARHRLGVEVGRAAPPDVAGLTVFGMAGRKEPEIENVADGGGH